jgi:hypothetical protein
MTRALRIVGLLVVGFLAIYLAGCNAAFWVWVAHSAFLGIRAPRDVGLGFESVAFALIPPAAGTIAGVFASHRGRTRTAYLTLSSAVAALAAIPFIFMSIVATVI